MSRLIPRFLWFFPAALLLLTVNQAKVAVDLKETLETGESAVASVLNYTRIDRKDVPHGEVSLRIELADGQVIQRKKLALPYSLVHRVEKEKLDVRVLPGAAQEVVITDIAGTQSRIAAINAAISLVGFLMFATGIFVWNRSLHRDGNPVSDY